MKRFYIPFIVLLLTSLACSLGTTAPVATNVPDQPAQVEESTQPVPMPPLDEVPPASNSACDNIYMPVISGATWNYSLVGATSDTYVHSILSVGDSSFVEQDAFASGVTRTGEWACADGNLTALNPAGGGASVNTDGLASEFTATFNDGITFPANPQPGTTWTQSVMLEGSQTINGYTAATTNAVNTVCTAVNMETVSVAAGTFETLRVECAVQMIITATVEGTSFDTTLNTTSTAWYAPNVGMVKTVTSGNGLDSTIELQSYNLPQ